MDTTLEETRTRLKQKLDACVQTGEITLSSGKVTDFYFDGRLVSLEPEGSVLLARCLLDEAVRLEVSAVGGLTSGADPLTTGVGVLAYQTGVPLNLFYVRKEAKGHGMLRRIEGPPLPEGTRAALLDDVLTTGGSLLKARDALREDAGIEAACAIVVIDREEGGKERLEAEGLAVRSLFSRSDFLA